MTPSLPTRALAAAVALLTFGARAASELQPQVFELPYTALEGRAKRIIVQVRLNERVTAPMALDTGAPGTILSHKLAEAIGVFSRDQGRLMVEARGIGGGTPAIRTIIDTVALGAAVEHFVPVTITESMSSAFDGLIGMDVMSQYAMTVDSKRSVVILKQQLSSEEAPGGHSESWWRDNFAEFRGLRDAWSAYRERLAQEMRDSTESAGNQHDALVNRRALAELQYQEAEKLLSRLDRYASEYAVPRHWR